MHLTNMEVESGVEPRRGRWGIGAIAHCIGAKFKLNWAVSVGAS